MRNGHWSALRWHGDERLESYADRALSHAVQALRALQGVFYYKTDEGELQAVAGHAVDMRKIRKRYALGEGLPGQALRLGKTYRIDDPSLIAATAAGAICRVPIRALVVAPLMYNEQSEGVVELSFSHSTTDLATVAEFADTVGAALNYYRMQAVRRALYEQMREKHALLESREQGLKTALEQLQAAQQESERMARQLADGQAKLSALIDSADDYIFNLDLEGVCTVANEPFLQSMHPFNPVGKHFSLWMQEARDQFEEGFRHALSGRRSRFHFQSGERRFEATMHPARDSQGVVVGAGVFVRDVTERVRQEEAIRALNETLEKRVAERTRELETALESLKSAQGQLVQAEKMAALGQLVAGVAHEINTPLGVVKGAAADLNATVFPLLRGFHRFVHEVLTPAYETLFFEFVEKALGGTITLTSREERQYRKNLADRLAELGVENAADVARELVRMGVFEGVEAYVELLRHPRATQILETASSLGWVKRHLANIEAAVGRTQKIVFALKNYSRKSGDESEVDYSVVETVETVLTIHQNAMKKGVQLIREYDDDLPTLRGDPDELTQVWNNLIVNALQAMKYEGELSVRIKRRDGDVCVSVGDSGPGIAPEIMPKIFDPFFTTKPAGEGTGLGLDICRKIVEKHGGRIEVESDSNGAVFHVYLPIR
ncbi:MAG: ATP-binding protein [Bacteroidia bacterium]|nr:ATP-binding protein [Bacteroidia bacterium]